MHEKYPCMGSLSVALPEILADETQSEPEH